MGQNKFLASHFPITESFKKDERSLLSAYDFRNSYCTCLIVVLLGLFVAIGSRVGMISLKFVYRDIICIRGGKLSFETRSR